MCTTSLIDADQKFSRALDELRGKYCGAFASWLNSPPAPNPPATWHDIEQKITLLRGHFVDEFISTSGPAILDDLNPGAKQDIIEQLRQFVTRTEKRPQFALPARSDGTWRPGAPRTVAGAAIGAAAALLLFALQAGPPVETVAPSKPNQVMQQPAAPVAPALAPLAAPPVLTPAESTPAERAESIAQAALRIIVGALGAALGAFVVVCPPLRTVLAGFGFQLRRQTFGLAGIFGVAFLLLRRIALAAAVIAMLIIAAGFVGLIFIGPKPIWSILFGLAAILGIVLARYGIPSRTARASEAIRATAIDAFDRQLSIDADIWSALTAALSIRWTATVHIDPILDNIRSFVVERRNRNDPADVILRIVEQELRLTPGGASVGPQPTEFKWMPQSADQYDAVEIVALGDTVTVLEPPRMTKDAKGNPVVVEKGKVMRKPEGE